MKIQGIRISDGKDNVLRVTLSDILKEVADGSSFYWVILFLDGTPNPGKGVFLQEYENKINNSENGLTIKWDELLSISSNFFQMFETIILGSKDPKLLKRYEKEEDMYRTCDIVIDLIDCAFWEVYSKEQSFINKLKKKFKEVELIEVS